MVGAVVGVALLDFLGAAFGLADLAGATEVGSLLVLLDGLGLGSLGFIGWGFASLGAFERRCT